MTGPIPERVSRRALERWVPAEGSDCRISTYSVASHGYAQIGWQSKTESRSVTTAHRAVWVAITGEQIPEGMTIDHTCKNRSCVNPNHLRMLSNYENARRTGGRDWPLGQCIRGHSNSEMYRTPSGKRVCRQCRREWSRAHYLRPGVKEYKREWQRTNRAAKRKSK